MTWGVDGDTGSLVDMTDLGVWDPLSVKVQTYKTAIEVRGGGGGRGRSGTISLSIVLFLRDNSCVQVKVLPSVDSCYCVFRSFFKHVT